MTFDTVAHFQLKGREPLCYVDYYSIQTSEFVLSRWHPECQLYLSWILSNTIIQQKDCVWNWIAL